MSESKHTPGPWIVGDSGVHGGWAGIYSEGEREIIAEAQAADVGPEIALANARLIAAAPLLYGALKALTTTPHMDLGDLVYTIKEREGEGWDGPAVTAWGKAVVAAKEALDAVEQFEDPR